MEFNTAESSDFKIRKNKLKKMKLISTSLLVIVGIIYFILKKFKVDQSDNLFYSSLVAFTEASMVGGFADWFAVVALFRHPLGMSWIPHTAIIKKNKNEIGEALSKFVVDNFFTDEKINDMLKNFQFSRQLEKYLSESKNEISRKIVQGVPEYSASFLKNDYLKGFIVEKLDNNIGKIKLSPLAGVVLDQFVLSTENNIRLVKAALEYILKELENNKQLVVSFIQKQKFIAFIGVPNVFATSIHTSLCNFLNTEINNINSNVSTGFSKLLLNKIYTISKDLQQSEEMIQAGENLKEEILSSEEYKDFTNKKMWDILEKKVIDPMILVALKNPEVLSDKINDFIENIIINIFKSEEMSENIDTWVRNSFASVVSANKVHIGELISRSVKEWNEDEVVEKLELQVGSDLQYIRINGTIVGGIFGVLIHLASHFLV